MGITEFFSSFTKVYADEEEKPENNTQNEAVNAEQPQQEAEEPEEPEDPHPVLREECKQSAKCAALTKHFEHCQEKVEAGQGFKGEECVEELFHMMHCVDDCAAPKLFSKLK